jgi:hypothetical protein
VVADILDMMPEGVRQNKARLISIDLCVRLVLLLPLWLHPFSFSSPTPINSLRKKQARTIMQHLSEAWRCWKVRAFFFFITTQPKTQYDTTRTQPH